MAGTDSPVTLSVCIPTVGSSPYLAETLASVKRAWQPACELVIVDNAPGQAGLDTQAAAAGLAARVVTTPRRLAMGANWNFALSQARGRWVHLLHDDDWIDPDFYERALADLSAAPDAGLWMCGSHDVYDPADPRRNPVVPARQGLQTDPAAWTRLMLLQRPYRCAAAILNRERALALDGFDPDMRQLLDMDLFWRLGLVHGAWLNPRPMAYWRVHGTSATNAGSRPGRMLGLDDGRVLRDTKRLFANTVTARGRTGLWLARYLAEVTVWAALYFLRHAELQRLAEPMGLFFSGCRSLLFPSRRTPRAALARAALDARRRAAPSGGPRP